MQNSDFWTRIANLYGSQISPVVLCIQNSVISSRITSFYGFQPSPVVLSMQYSVISTRITCLHVSQLLFSMGPSPHLWFLNAKQRLLGQNYMSLWVLDLTCRFMHAKQHLLDQNYKSICVPAHNCGFVH